MQPHIVMVKRPTVDDFMAPHMFAGPKSVGKFHQAYHKKQDNDCDVHTP